MKDTAEAVEYLKSTEGDILVTTGSKELEAFCALPDYKTGYMPGCCRFPRWLPPAPPWALRESI